MRSVDCINCLDNFHTIDILLRVSYLKRITYMQVLNDKSVMCSDPYNGSTVYRSIHDCIYTYYVYIHCYMTTFTPPPYLGLSRLSRRVSLSCCIETDSTKSDYEGG